MLLKKNVAYKEELDAIMNGEDVDSIIKAMEEKEEEKRIQQEKERKEKEELEKARAEEIKKRTLEALKNSGYIVDNKEKASDEIQNKEKSNTKPDDNGKKD